MKDLIGTFVIMLFCIIALAREKPSENIILLSRPKSSLSKSKQLTEKSVAVRDTNVTQFNSPVSLQVLLGSQGIGADVKYGFLPKVSGRLGFGIIPVDASRGFGFSGFKVNSQLSSRFSNLHLLADYSPFENRDFRVVGGAAYLIQGNAKAIITPSDGYKFENRSLTKDQIGLINADVTWKGLAPYLGVALFRSFPNQVFNINLDVGTYYLSRPQTSFTGTKLLSDNDANTKQFNENMKGYRWLPVIQLDFNFRLK